MPPRLVRRRSLADRITSCLHPTDISLWLSEELNSGNWDQWQKDWATPIGILINIIFLVARSNNIYRNGDDADVFGDEDHHPSWKSWLVAFTVHLLSLLSLLNAIYAFHRRRHYRMFGASVDTVPSTPSARRVQINSSSMSSPSLRMLSALLVSDDDEQQAPTDKSKEVWELALWDPTALALRLFCLFSPAHILVYWLFLPTAYSDPQPSVTIVKTVFLICLLSLQLLYLQSSYSQQSKDSSIIQKEVLNEYNTKYVHPRTRSLMRDVATQFSTRDKRDDLKTCNSVNTYTPTFVVNKGFHTRPNPNYIKLVDPDNTAMGPTPSKGISTSLVQSFDTPAHIRDVSSPMRPMTAFRQPRIRSSAAGDGGNLGIYSHAHSPMRKSASAKFASSEGFSWESIDAARRAGSPLKRSGGIMKPN